MVSDVTISGALNNQAKTQASTTKLAEDFSQFLNLLTVQLQNQDPLSPMDTTEFTNQLVAFTGVEQQINTNQKLDDLVALNLGSSFSAAQNYVGKRISYVSSEFQFTGEAADIRYSLSENASLSQIKIVDEFGATVYETEGSKIAGAHEFVWGGETEDGSQAPPGTYQIVVDALNAEDKPIQVTSVVEGRVSGIETQNGNIFLIVGERAVGLSNVLNTSESNLESSNNNVLTAALSYVGLEVSYINDQIEYDGTHQENILYSLDRDAQRAKLIVKDEAGKTVYIGDTDADGGNNITTWNGTNTDGSPAPAGIYTFTIDAIDSEDKRVGFKSLGNGLVTGVESQNNNIFLMLGSKSVRLDKVLTANVAEEA